MSEIAARPLICLIEGGIAARGAGPARALIKRSPVALPLRLSVHGKRPDAVDEPVNVPVEKPVDRPVHHRSEDGQADAAHPVHEPGISL